MKSKRTFASDNNSGVHSLILSAINEVNQGHALAYGADFYTELAIAEFKKIFGDQISVYFVFNGTGANVLALKALTDSFSAIICSESAHINVDECNAPEKFTGCKLLTVPSPDGKITVEGISSHLHGFGFEHHAQPKVVSLTQSTELGTVYTPVEIKTISRFIKDYGMYLHLDGARIANAAASLGVSLKEITVDCGVDVLSFGGTKNGLMFGEAVVFFNQDLAKGFKYYRKQAAQLYSKMRFISSQFSAYLSTGLWLENALHSNKMAQILAEKLEKIPQLKITQKVQANGIFAILPQKFIPKIQEQYFFYVWNEKISEVRFMTSFDTTFEDIENFVDFIKKIVHSD